MLTGSQMVDGVTAVLSFLVYFLIFVGIIEGLLYIVVGGVRQSSPLRLIAPLVVALLGVVLVFVVGMSWLQVLLLASCAEVIVVGLLINQKLLAPIGLALLTLVGMLKIGGGSSDSDPFFSTIPGIPFVALNNVWPFVLVAGAAMLLMMIGAITQPKVSLAYMLISPAVIAISLLVIYPFIYTVFLAFSDAGRNFRFLRYGEAQYSLQLGWENFSRVFSGTLLPDKDSTFFNLLLITIAWTVINVVFHVSGGMGLALLLNRDMRGRAIYRTILVLPWAVPGIIAILALRGEFNYNYGFINIMLRNLGFDAPQWYSDQTSAFIMVVIINVWLGIPFMMVSILGGLQSISKEYYEAAEIDGANGWQQFRNITIPLVQPVLTPIVILGTIWTFNNFNAIYLGDQQGKTNILVTGLYRMFGELGRYNIAAAYSLVIFALLLIFAIGWIRLNGGLKGVYES